ncbi:MAG: lipopolysaccharide exporter [Saprospiraceae bacterium]|jgi:lipopolysaccharide exporter
MPNSSIKSTSYSFLSLVSLMGANLIAFVILIRVLSEYEFGVWVLYTSIIAFVEMARNGLIQNGLIKFMTANPAAEAAIGKTALSMTMIGSLIGSVLLFALSFPLSMLWEIPELTTLVAGYFIYSITSGVLKFMEFFQMGKHQFDGIFWGNVAYGSCLILGILGWQYSTTDSSLIYLVGIQTVAVVVAIFTVFNLKKDLFSPLKTARFSTFWMKKLFHFGKYVFGTNFSSMLFNKTDILMLGTFLNPAAVAIYSLATRVNNYLDIPVNALAQVIYPKIAKVDWKNDKSQIIHLYEQSIGLLLLIILPMSAAVFLFAKPIILLLSGNKYEAAVPILQILLIAGLIKPWGRLFGITLDAIGKPKMNFKMLIFSLLVNIVTNLILIPLMGMKGAALATGLSIWITILVGQIYLSSLLNVNHWRIFKNIWRTAQQSLTLLKIRFFNKNTPSTLF